MTSILSWNIQNGLGVDGVRSLDRIAGVIRSHQSPDILCLQEVSRGLALDEGATASDQPAELAALFPEYAMFFGPAYDIAVAGSGRRAQYGNVILSRLPVLSAFLHQLPQPAVAATKQMPRQMTEVTVLTDNGELRIMTTHLEFHSVKQRSAQINAIRLAHEQIVALAHTPPEATAGGPYQTLHRAGDAVICGDFNCLADSHEMDLLLATPEMPQARLLETWRSLYPNQPHEPSCGIFDTKQWPGGAHCRDFFVVSDSLRSRVKSQHTDIVTAASDHQPVLLNLAG